MASRTMIDIDEDFNKEMKSIHRLQRAALKIRREFKRKSKSLRRELKTMYRKIRSIQRLLKPKSPKSSRVTSTKLTKKGHEDPMGGENPIPSAPHEDFFPDKKQPPNSSTKPTLLSNTSPENYEHGNQLEEESSHLLRKRNSTS